MSHNIINSYFPNLTLQQKDQFARMEALYFEWNKKINVISRKDIDQLYVRHVLHSLGISAVIAFNDGTKLLDVGTGGGFPGIPLAVLFPNCHFHLVDSKGKKITVVKGVSQALELTNLTSEHIRAEQVKDEYDFVISRAVTRIKPFCKWVKNKFRKKSFNELNNGILYLKGGDLTEELQESEKRYKLYELSHFFKEDFFETKKVIYIPYS